MKITGYRTESYSGEGKRDLLKVTSFEINNLGNNDIPLTIKKKYKRTDYSKFLQEIYRKGYKKCVWLCRKKSDLTNHYAQSPEDEIDRYVISDGIILSNLREDGVLVAYRGEPLISYCI